MTANGRSCVAHLDRLVENLTTCVIECPMDKDRAKAARLLKGLLRFESCPLIDQCGGVCAGEDQSDRSCEAAGVVRAVRAALSSVSTLDGLPPAERFARLRHARDVVDACRALITSA